MKSDELGERKIIEIILKQLEPMPNMPIPFGDDVSAIDIERGKLIVVKTDMLVAKTDMPPQMSLQQAARKAVVMNISDLAAKGIEPAGLMVALGLPRGLKKRDIVQIGQGLNQGAREYGTYILGGDTSEASDIVISVAAFGIGEKRHMVMRSGAKPNDVVAVTGLFGKTAAGLKLLLQNFNAPASLRKALVKCVLEPQARLKEGLALAATDVLTASIDSSDGLGWSLHELSRASNIGLIIDRLPLAEEAMQFARLHGLDLVELCLYGGEEYELVVTIRPEKWQKAREQTPLFKIGRVTKEKALILKQGKKKLSIEARGWEHFKTSL